jgi:hypothetical protein
LGVGVLEQLNGTISTCGRVQNKGCVPTDHCEVIGVVRDRGLQYLVLLVR